MAWFGIKWSKNVWYAVFFWGGGGDFSKWAMLITPPPSKKCSILNFGWPLKCSGIVPMIWEIVGKFDWRGFTWGWPFGTPELSCDLGRHVVFAVEHPRSSRFRRRQTLSGSLSKKCPCGNKMGTHKLKKVSCGFYKLFRPQGTRRISETTQPSRPKATATRTRRPKRPKNKEEESCIP